MDLGCQEELLLLRDTVLERLLCQVALKDKDIW